MVNPLAVNVQVPTHPWMAVPTRRARWSQRLTMATSACGAAQPVGTPPKSTAAGTTSRQFVEPVDPDEPVDPLELEAVEPPPSGPPVVPVETVPVLDELLELEEVLAGPQSQAR